MNGSGVGESCPDVNLSPEEMLEALQSVHDNMRIHMRREDEASEGAKRSIRELEGRLRNFEERASMANERSVSFEERATKAEVQLIEKESYAALLSSRLREQDLKVHDLQREARKSREWEERVKEIECKFKDEEKRVKELEQKCKESEELVNGLEKKLEDAARLAAHELNMKASRAEEEQQAETYKLVKCRREWNVKYRDLETQVLALRAKLDRKLSHSKADCDRYWSDCNAMVSAIRAEISEEMYQNQEANEVFVPATPETYSQVGALATSVRRCSDCQEQSRDTDEALSVARTAGRQFRAVAIEDLESESDPSHFPIRGGRSYVPASFIFDEVSLQELPQNDDKHVTEAKSISLDELQVQRGRMHGGQQLFEAKSSTLDDVLGDQHYGEHMLGDKSIDLDCMLGPEIKGKEEGGEIGFRRMLHGGNVGAVQSPNVAGGCGVGDVESEQDDPDVTQMPHRLRNDFSSAESGKQVGKSSCMPPSDEKV